MWTLLDDEPPVLVGTYSIGPGNETNTLVVGFGDGELLVVSPGSDPTDEQLRALEPYGRVTTLVAPNLFHHSGLAAWHAAFPEARVCAADGSLGAWAKKSTVPLDGWSALELGPSVRLHASAGVKHAETWVEVLGSERTLYCGDAFLNMAAVPWFPLGWLLRPLGLGPGFRRNPVRRRLLVDDLDAHGAWLESLLAENPTRLVPGHGDVVESPDLAARLRELWEG